MLHRYLPMTEQDQQQMLAAIGVSSVMIYFQIFRSAFVFKENTILKKRPQSLSC